MKKLNIGFCSTFETAMNFFIWALHHRYDVNVVDPDKADYLIFGDPNFGDEHLKYRNCKRILYTGENYRPNYFTFDHAMTFDHENSPKHYRLPLWVPEMHQYWNSGVTESIDCLATDPYYTVNKKTMATGFCTFIQSNPNMQIRNHFVQTLMKYKKVDCGGKVMNNIGGELPRNSGQDKIDFLEARKFNVAIENGLYPGYCTEKILDAFYARTIPIYLGSTTVERDFNPGRYINCHDFENLDQVVEYIKELDADEQKYMDIVTEPIWKENRMPSCANPNNLLDWWEAFVE